MEMKRVLVNALLVLSFAFAALADDKECVYTVYVKTGSIIKAGTDSKITLELWSEKGDGVRITDMENSGGLMGKDHDYFERGQLDIFSGRGPCLSKPVCGMRVISDGSGPHHGWYLSYVQVTTTGPHIQCAQRKFDVYQWLATDAPPYALTVVRNFCPVQVTPQFLPTKVISSS